MTGLALPADVPVDPDRDTAQQWAEDELAKEIYSRTEGSWLQRAAEWVSQWLDRIFSFEIATPGGGGFIVAIVVGVLVVALVLWIVLGPVRRARSRVKKREFSVFEEDARPAAEIVTAAEAAARAGDWRLAVIEAYRALVRDLEERDLIDDRPGITAHEAAEMTGARFADVAADMLTAADAFDSARYGAMGLAESDYDQVRATARRLRGRSILTASPA